MAGICLLVQNPQEAIDYYRRVLHFYFQSVAAEASEDMKYHVDVLQIIHAMHNLAEVLGKHPPLERTLRDSTIKEDCLEMEKKYMKRCNDNVSVPLFGN